VLIEFGLTFRILSLFLCFIEGSLHFEIIRGGEIRNKEQKIRNKEQKIRTKEVGCKKRKKFKRVDPDIMFDSLWSVLRAFLSVYFSASSNDDLIEGNSLLLHS
jgi:hypothetical protein